MATPERSRAPLPLTVTVSTPRHQSFVPVAIMVKENTLAGLAHVS
jgi:hypothetical protein